MWPSSVFGTRTAVDEQRRADARAEGQDEDRPELADAGPEAHLGDPGGIGVVDDATSRR